MKSREKIHSVETLDKQDKGENLIKNPLDFNVLKLNIPKKEN